MDFEQPDPTDELFHRDPQWIAENGRYLHGNNVLFYFAQSPFFDRQSNNNSVFLQAVSDPRFASWLVNRQSFEAQLARVAGTEYVVTYDPIVSNVRDKTGEVSSVWVIQKQNRKKRPAQDDEVTPIAIYYIVGDAIYQAPTMAKLIGNRMLSTVTSMNKVMSTAASLPLFSAAHGHTYLPASHQQSHPNQTALSQHSKETTPAPDAAVTTNGQPIKSKSSTTTTDYEDTQLFLDALNLSRRYGKEYMDEAPLLGEPGNFRISRVREAPTRSAETAVEKEPSPTIKERSVSAAPPPPIQTDVPQIASKKSAKAGGDRSPSTPGVREKPKRRKSRPNVTPTDT